jgi:hypothetical protein
VWRRERGHSHSETASPCDSLALSLFPFLCAPPSLAPCRQQQLELIRERGALGTVQRAEYRQASSPGGVT